MKRGDKVRVTNADHSCDSFLVGMEGVIVQSFDKSCWDDPDVPEFSVTFPDIKDSDGLPVHLNNMWFTVNELEVV